MKNKMKNETKISKRLLAIVLTAIMVLSVCAVIPAMGYGEPTVTRLIVPTTVSPGEDFLVTVAFTAPAPQDIYTEATITDKIRDPDDWDVSIESVTPDPYYTLEQNNATLVIWGANAIKGGDPVAVMYRLTVPGDAEERDYDFVGKFTTDIWGEIAITGADHVTVSVPDEKPPVISSVASSSITTNSATITWDTDEISDSLVKYGTAQGGPYTEQEYDAADVTSHSIDLAGLSADTTYYYVVNSTDPSDNSAESTEYSFTTEAAAGTGTIVGQITYACNGTEIEGALVNLTQGSVVASTTTDSDGNYEFTDVTPGDYYVNASKSRFWDNSTDVTVNAGVTTTADMMLWLKGDLNNNGMSADAGDLTLMKRASVGEISGDWRYNLNNNDMIADAGDLTLMKRASVGEIVLM